MMKFSVIIPCYNAAATIERALGSLLQQTVKECEAICIDDCSNDDTVEKIKKYAAQNKGANITIICNEKNVGPGSSRNRGISVAQGEYLCFLDSDDFYEINTIEVLDEKIKKTNADIVFFGSNQILGSTKRKRPIPSRNSIPEYMALVGGSLCMAVWRRSLWKGIELPHISNAEDIAVIPILISRAKTVITTSELLYNYVHSNNSTSSRHHPRVSYNFVTSFHYTLQHIEVASFHDAVEFHGIKTIIYGATLNALKAGMSRKEIIELWAEFEQTFPRWWKNEYLKSYNQSKRIFVWLAARRFFILMYLYARIHDTFLRMF